ncbi:MAG: putative LPS assembly protein LptD, partial [Cryomorphaceae bacterium]
MFIIGASRLFAQERDTIPGDVDIILPSDSIMLDSGFVAMHVDSLPADSLNSDAVIKSEVNYSASDSIDNDVVNKIVYLYGNAKIEYEDITLTGAKIVYDFDSYTVHAEGIQDTLGNWQGLPVFKQGNSEFEAREMDYNFKSKKAFVKKVQTDIVEGTLTGKTVKTTQDNRVIYIKNGEYCPCEDPNALTRFKIGKLKVIKDDKIVSGPGYLTLGPIPTPLAFPFGFFPNAEKRQAGIVVPSYGNAQSQGFFLADGGFYLPIGDNWDTKMLFDVYSRGSWGLENLTRYKKRYKFDGNFNIEYNNNVRGDRDLNNFSAQRNFFLTWMHTQDRKARPNSNFSADIRAGSTANYQNNLNASQNDYLTNTFRSNIRYSKSFPDSPWSLALNAGHSQNSRTGNYDFTLPEVALNRARTFPLDGVFNDSPKQQFYEKIGITYNSAFQNSLSVQEEELSLNNLSGLMQKFRNGVRHNASVSTSLKAGPVSINPSFNYTERWYFETYDRRFDEDSQSFVPDTVKGFDRNGNWDFSTSMTTK